jgi:hypothetical protein
MQAGSNEAKALSWLLLVVQLCGTTALALVFPHADMLEGGCALLSSSLETISLLCAALLQYEPSSSSIQVRLHPPNRWPHGPALNSFMHDHAQFACRLVRPLRPVCTMTAAMLQPKDSSAPLLK